MSLRAETGSGFNPDAEPESLVEPGSESVPAVPEVASIPDADATDTPDTDTFQARSARRDGSFRDGEGLNRLIETFPNGVGNYLRRSAERRDGKVPPIRTADGPSMEAIMAAKRARQQARGQGLKPRDGADR
ncbi:MAG: hypothetical protein WD603_01460 [Patescibacteria group bacterium]